jgi:hypothetical protein
MNYILKKAFGLRLAVLFGSIAFCSTAILVALFMTTSYAVANYAAEQLARIPWDVVVGQQADMGSGRDFVAHYASLPTSRHTDTFGMLRIQNGESVEVTVDGKPIAIRWLVFVAASDRSLLPSELRIAPKPGVYGKASTVNVAVVDPNGRDVEPLHVGAGSTIAVAVSTAHEHDESNEGALEQEYESGTLLFTGKVADSPAQLDRQEFNKWMLERVGALSYMPELALVVEVPLSEYHRISSQFDISLHDVIGADHGEAAPPYSPELIHLIQLNREGLVSPWRLDQSAIAVAAIAHSALAYIRDAMPQSYANSDLHSVLASMSAISHVIGLLVLLFALPLLLLGWVTAEAVGKLLLMNERRQIGLLLVRGVPLSMIASTLRRTMWTAGLVGGALGILGSIVAVGGWYYTTSSLVPPLSLILRGLSFFALCVGFGVALAIFSGETLLRQIRKTTPRASVARFTQDGASDRQRVGFLIFILSIVAVVFSGWRIASWLSAELAGPKVQTLTHARSHGFNPLLFDFIAVPLFLFGMLGVLNFLPGLVRRVFDLLTWPFAGRLHWVTSRNLTLTHRRTATAVFISALSMALSVMPQVASDTFADRVSRGVAVALGADVQIDFDLAKMSEYQTPAQLADFNKITAPRIAAIRAALLAVPGVTSAVDIQQYLLPGIYLPDQAGLPIDLISDPTSYRSLITSDDRLGLTKPLSTILSQPQLDGVASSQGLLLLRELAPGDRAVAGYSSDARPIPMAISDVFALLPGQPSHNVMQREGYNASEIDYLNFASGMDARVYSDTKSFIESDLSNLPIVPSQVVFLVRMKTPPTARDIQAILQKLPGQPPRDVRWLGHELEAASRDMFLSLSLENMRVFRIAGIALAIAGILAVGAANFISNHRMFALLRVRGASPALVFRVAVSIFMLPVLVGILLGSCLGIAAGYGLAHVIWMLPRVRGASQFLGNHWVITTTTWLVVIGLGMALFLAASFFGLASSRSKVAKLVRRG